MTATLAVDGAERDSLAVLDTHATARRLRAEAAGRGEDRASMLLLRQPPVRVLLTWLAPGAELGSERADESLLVTVLSGAATVRLGHDADTLAEREVALIPPGGGWSLRAVALEAVILATFWGTPGTADPSAPPAGLATGT